MRADNMSLFDLMVHLKVDHVNCDFQVYPTINALSIDSRYVNENILFIAVSGIQTSGHKYIDDAAKNGCKLAFVDTQNKQNNGELQLRVVSEKYSISLIYIYNLHSQLADVAYIFYTGKTARHVSANELVAVSAITGTNGKTSVASLMAQLYSVCGKPCATIGTLGVNMFTHGAQRKLKDTHNTTPDIVSLIDMLAHAKDEGCTNAVIEASSHGLAQNRLSKLNIGCAVFTNLSQDHLDYHSSMSSYAKAKRGLLTCSGVNIIVLNYDDAESINWQNDASNKQKLYWFSLNALPADKHGCWAQDIRYSTQGISLVLHANMHGAHESQAVSIELIGAFNVANVLAAITALLAQGTPFSALTKACESITAVAGRMEIFASSKATVLVDYAHTPDALKQALLAARVHTQGTLSCIFGCGGNRDVSKRALMGRIAQQHADNIVLTQDNSRCEAPSDIVADIRTGMQATNSDQKISVELDREKAIAQTWQHSKAGDVILVAGKGHEDYIEINNQRIAYNERDVVKELLSKRASYKVKQQGDML